MRALGSASEIETLVRRWREAVLFEAQAPGVSPRRSLARYRAAGAALRRRVWDPIQPALEGAKRVYLVPDGILHLVSFAGLPEDRGGYVVETGPVLQVLSAERDLLAPAARLGEGMLVMGDPDHEGVAERPQRATSAQPVPSEAGLRGPRPECGALGRRRFEPLAHAAVETDTVVALWRASSGEEDLRLLRKRAASEAAFKQQAPGRRVLHLATHGFFLGQDCASALDGSLPPGVGENPLLRAGLAWAGANRRGAAAPAEDDGILTAEEVAPRCIDATSATACRRHGRPGRRSATCWVPAAPVATRITPSTGHRSSPPARTADSRSSARPARSAPAHERLEGHPGVAVLHGNLSLGVQDRR